MSKGKEHPNDLLTSGDFFAHADQAKSLATWETINAKPGMIDLISICCQWYKKPPQKMIEQIQIGKSESGIDTVSLSNISVDGSW